MNLYKYSQSINKYKLLQRREELRKKYVRNYLKIYKMMKWKYLIKIKFF